MTSLLLVLLACASPAADTGPTGLPDTGDPPDPPQDLDGDGYDDTVDCDDLDPAVSPGQDETWWNGVDDDCDGHADADGEYGGTASVEARVVYEGTPRTWRLDCPTTLVRAAGRLDLDVRCTPDPDDALAVQLLGGTLRLEEDDNVVSGDAWSGAVRVVSGAGWEAAGTGALSWSDLEHAALAVAVDTVSLDLEGAADLAR